MAGAGVNAYAVIILAALAVEYAIDLVTDLLNLRALKPDAPTELADVYDADRYRRSQEYTRARTRFGRSRPRSTSSCCRHSGLPVVSAVSTSSSASSGSRRW